MAARPRHRSRRDCRHEEGEGDAERRARLLEEGLAIFRRLADADKADADWQHDISVALDKIGYLKFRRQGQRQALSPPTKKASPSPADLADADPNNAVWQRDIGVGLNKIGDVKYLLRRRR